MAVEAVGERIAGEPQPRFRAFVVALGVGIAAGVATYKLLRSGGSEDGDAA